jgi:DNA-binding HxlR family transcriptional regulator
MISRRKKISAAPAVANMVEDIVGCKWSLAVLGRIRSGVVRPGAMEHALPGLSKKVLNERLRKLVRFGIVERHAYAELPPRVEYRLTAFGEKFSTLLDGVERLQRELGADAPGVSAAASGGTRPAAAAPRSRARRTSWSTRHR